MHGFPGWLVLGALLMAGNLTTSTLASDATDEGVDSPATLGNGMEVGDARRLRVIVEPATGDAKKINLNDSIIEARVSKALRDAGIIPVDLKTYTGPEGACLYIRVTVVGAAFSVDLQFQRIVLYSARGQTHDYTAATWSKSMTGSWRERQFILQAVTETAEIFCNEFLKANGG